LLPDVDGVFVLGSSGEFALLEDTMRAELINRTVERVEGRRPVYVGVGDTGTRRTIANARRASRAGVDALVVCGPFYYPVTDQGALRAHFEAVADAVDRPVLLYNIPENTVSALTPDSVVALAMHPNIVGIKDSGGTCSSSSGSWKPGPARSPSCRVANSSPLSRSGRVPTAWCLLSRTSRRRASRRYATR